MSDLFGGNIQATFGGGRKAYAAAPGSGPPGKCCRDCAHARGTGHNRKTYWKCSLVKSTSGPGTDIRLKTPACFHFVQKEAS